MGHEAPQSPKARNASASPSPSPAGSARGSPTDNDDALFTEIEKELMSTTSADRTSSASDAASDTSTISKATNKAVSVLDNEIDFYKQAYESKVPVRSLLSGSLCSSVIRPRLVWPSLAILPRTHVRRGE